MRLNIDGADGITVIRKGNAQVCRLVTENQLPYFIFENLEQTGIVRHAFSTRLGGVSCGDYATLNFSFTRGDDKQAVLENYRRMAEALGTTPSHMVASHQTHTTNVRRVTAADLGKGVTVDRDYSDIDGLITNESGIVLSCFFADCVPLYLVDTRYHAIGLAHSGWRGTAARMGQAMLDAMHREFGTMAEDVEVAIGPSICQDCYEVDAPVAEIFARQFPDDDSKAEAYLQRYQENITSKELRNCLLVAKSDDKYLLNLWYANYRVFCDAGVPDRRIAVTDVCTCCNPSLLFSHRASHGRRGNLGAFLMMK